MDETININCIIIYRIIKNKIKEQVLNVKLFSLEDIKYLLFLDETIKGILIK